MRNGVDKSLSNPSLVTVVSNYSFVFRIGKVKVFFLVKSVFSMLGVKKSIEITIIFLVDK